MGDSVFYWYLRNLRSRAGYKSRAALGDACGLDGSTIARLEQSKSNQRPEVDTLKKLAPVLNVDLETLLIMAGYTPINDEFLNIWGHPSDEVSSNNHISTAQIKPKNLVRIPVLGKISAGQPITAIEEADNWLTLDKDIHLINGYPIDEFFCLKVIGISMEPTIHDGEIILAHWQDTINPGEVGVFLCNEYSEATIKRYRLEGGQMVLIPDNKQFPVQVYSPDNCRVLGKVLQSVFRPIV